MNIGPEVTTIPIWRDPNFIVSMTTLIGVAAKWLADKRTAKKHDEKLDTITTQTNGINQRLSNQNDQLTQTVKEQAKVIASTSGAATDSKT